MALIGALDRAGQIKQLLKVVHTLMQRGNTSIPPKLVDFARTRRDAIRPTTSPTNNPKVLRQQAKHSQKQLIFSYKQLRADDSFRRSLGRFDSVPSIP